MTDLDAAAYLHELRKYNQENMMRTPKNSGFDMIYDGALDHAIRALEDKARVRGMVDYKRNPNGSYRAVLKPEYRTTIETDP